MRIEGDDRAGLERLVRYCARGPLALERLYAPGGIASLASPVSSRPLAFTATATTASSRPMRG